MDNHTDWPVNISLPSSFIHLLVARNRVNNDYKIQFSSPSFPVLRYAGHWACELNIIQVTSFMQRLQTFSYLSRILRILMFLSFIQKFLRLCHIKVA